MVTRLSHFDQSDWPILRKPNQIFFKMANAQTVEGLALSGKIRKKTSVFWSTVPENDQFNNVQVPGVAMGGIKDARKHSQTQKFAQVVQKSKSDSAILGTRTDPLTVNKPGKSSQGIASKQNDFPGKKEEVSSLLKGIYPVETAI